MSRQQVRIAVPPLRDDEKIRDVQFALRYSTVGIRYIPDISSFKLLNHSITEIAGMPVISLSSSGMNAAAQLLKTAEDRVLAALIVIELAPQMLTIAIGVTLSSPGPVFFRKRRTGIGGETIEVIKSRSMFVHAEPAGQLTQA